MGTPVVRRAEIPTHVISHRITRTGDPKDMFVEASVSASLSELPNATTVDGALHVRYM
jgi:hypothetical protein